MGMLLVGLALTLLDFPLELAGGRVLDLTPDVLGYILMIFGIRQIGKYSHKFAIAYKFCYFTAIASAAVFGVNLLIGPDSMSMTIVLLGIAELILQVALMIFLAGGFGEMEPEFSINLHSKWLKVFAICIAVGILLGYASLFEPALKMVGSLVADIASFAYLILFYFSWEAYKAWKAKEEEDDAL